RRRWRASWIASRSGEQRAGGWPAALLDEASRIPEHASSVGDRLESAPELRAGDHQRQADDRPLRQLHALHARILADQPTDHADHFALPVEARADASRRSIPAGGRLGLTGDASPWKMAPSTARRASALARTGMEIPGISEDPLLVLQQGDRLLLRHRRAR